MKRKLEKNKCVPRLLALFTLLVFLVVPGGTVLAADLEIVARSSGLQVEPAGARLFDLTNLVPGDTETAKLTIRNSYNRNMKLFLLAKRVGEAPGPEEADIMSKLELTVKLGDELIYQGPLKSYAASAIELGTYRRNETAVLLATVVLPGASTDNSYQGQSVEVDWIFTAQTSGGGGGGGGDYYDPVDDTPPPPAELKEEEEVVQPQPEVPAPPALEGEETPEELPDTGERSPVGFYAAGILLLTAGVALVRKKES